MSEDLVSRDAFLMILQLKLQITNVRFGVASAFADTSGDTLFFLRPLLPYT